MSNLDPYPDRMARGSEPNLLKILPLVALMVLGFLMIRNLMQRNAEPGPAEGGPRMLRVDRRPGEAPGRGERIVLPPVERRRVAAPSTRTAEVSREASFRPADRSPLTSAEEATIELFRNSSPSVVFIATSTVTRDRLSFDVLEIPQGAGTGFVWDEKGHVVTNFHVVEDVITRGLRAKVTFADQESFSARIVGADPSKDLAVLEIQANSDRLVPIRVGRSRELSVGQSVFAIGNPFGFDHTLTTGVISGLGREIRARNNRRIEDVIQTDAAINPGNSGGPLLNSAGELIGVNTAIFSPSGAYAGIGFAIPVDTVARIIPQLIEHGEVVHPRLGITAVPEGPTRAVLRQLEVEGLGILIMEIAKNTPADKAGLRPTVVKNEQDLILGDLLTAIDGQRVETVDDLLSALDRRRLGEQVKLSIVRGLGTNDVEQLEVEVELTQLPETLR